MAQAPELSNQVDLGGRCLVLGFNGTRLDAPTASILSELRPAGIILFARNIRQRSQLQELMEALSEACAPRLVGLDQEGGRVDRLRGIFAAFPSAEILSRRDDEGVFCEYGELTGKVLHAFGFNVNFAPVLDLQFHDADNALKTRYLGSDPTRVALLARQYLSGLHSSGVAGCGKHFPGLGRACLDSHVQLPIVSAAVELLAGEDLVPYRYLSPHLKMVMISHAAYPGLENEFDSPATGQDGSPACPASCTSSAYRLLRSLRFKGIAITDDLDMGAVRCLPPQDIATSAFRAGADMLLIGADLGFAQACRDRLASLFEEPFWHDEAVWRAAKLDALPPVPRVDLGKIEELERRFLEWKRKLQID